LLQSAYPTRSLPQKFTGGELGPTYRASSDGNASVPSDRANSDAKTHPSNR
jgi:hypothetical protein